MLGTPTKSVSKGATSKAQTKKTGKNESATSTPKKPRKKTSGGRKPTPKKRNHDADGEGLAEKKKETG